MMKSKLFLCCAAALLFTSFFSCRTPVDPGNPESSSTPETTPIPGPVYRTVTFEPNGGAGTAYSQEILEGQTAALIANAFTRDGHSYQGWATASSGPVAFEDRATYAMGAANATLFAVWLAYTPPEQLTHTVIDGKVIITGYSGAGGVVNIPPEIDGYPVTGIGENAFQNCVSMTEIHLPDSLESIGRGAFYGCDGITSLAIPDSVTAMGDYAFTDCEGLVSVELGHGIETLGIEAFGDCDSLVSIDIPDSVTTIGLQAFLYCQALPSIFIPASVQSIGREAFLGCYELAAIEVDPANTAYRSSDGVLFTKDMGTLVSYPMKRPGTTYAVPSPVATIGQQAFMGNNGLESITMADTVKTIADRAFYGARWLASVELSDSFASIENFAFSYCVELVSMDFGSSVTSIGVGAFNNCQKLATIILPDSVSDIGTSAFSDCNQLASVTLPDASNSLNNLPYAVFRNCAQLNAITIPACVRVISREAFRDCAALESVILLGPSPIGLSDVDAFQNNAAGRLFYVPSYAVANYKAATNWSTYAAAITANP